jgi:uncharacterized protein (DUF362 family)
MPMSSVHSRRAFLAQSAAFALVPRAARAADRPLVAVVQGKDPAGMVAEALDLLGGIRRFVKAGDDVVLKPNVVFQPGFGDETGWVGAKKQSRPDMVTDVRIVDEVARQVRGAARCRVTCAEGSPLRLNEMFDFLGYREAAERRGMPLVNVDEAERRTVKVDGHGRAEYRLPAVTQDASVVVNLPAMKTHTLGGVTLGMKNLFGLLPMPKADFHDRLPEVLGDLVRIRKPDLTIVDGLVAMEGDGPLWGSPVPMGVVVAGRDMLAVDAVCTALMGFEPARVDALRLGAARGLGENDLRRIDVVGAPIAAVRRAFRPPTTAGPWVEIAGSDATLLQLRERADETRETRAPGAGVLLFDRRRLGDDPSLAADLTLRGFTAFVRPGLERVRVALRYDMLADRGDTRAARDALVRWLERTLGADGKPVAVGG